MCLSFFTDLFCLFVCLEKKFNFFFFLFIANQQPKKKTQSNFNSISVCSNLLRETKYFDFSHPEDIMNSTFGKSFLFLTKLAWNCKVTLPVLVTAVFLAMDFRMQIELNIETEQLVFQVI